MRPTAFPAHFDGELRFVMANSNVTPRQREDDARAQSAPPAMREAAASIGTGMPAGAGTKRAATCWPGLDLQVYSTLAEAEREWKVFEGQADCTVFQAYDWLAKWQQHIGSRNGTTPAIVLGYEAGGAVVFILQLAVETGRLTRRLTWLGSELCDYNAPLLAPDFSQRLQAGQFALLWREIVALLQSDRRFRFDLVDLQKMPETIGAQRNPFLDLAVLAHPSGAYIATLGNDWEAFYAAKRSASTRKRERRQLKHLAEHGKVRFIDVEGHDDIVRTLETLLSQKSRSFARMGVRNIFARPGYREFLLDIATDLNVRALTHISRLDVGEIPAAANLGLRFRNSYYLVLSSYHDGEIARFGPGRAHLHELLRHAIDSGFERFDFTVGDEPYKRDWSDTEMRLCDYLAATTVRGWLVMARMLAYRRTKRFIKQTPALWSLFSRARSFAASLRLL
jgi:CelD/BcsL family acetyltransferase involved in cellulose biosynthesis